MVTGGDATVSVSLHHGICQASESLGEKDIPEWGYKKS